MAGARSKSRRRFVDDCIEDEIAVAIGKAHRFFAFNAFSSENSLAVAAIHPPAAAQRREPAGNVGCERGRKGFHGLSLF
jgi:hypothetical protein